MFIGFGKRFCVYFSFVLASYSCRGKISSCVKHTHREIEHMQSVELDIYFPVFFSSFGLTDYLCACAKRNTCQLSLGCSDFCCWLVAFVLVSVYSKYIYMTDSSNWKRKDKCLEFLDCTNRFYNENQCGYWTFMYVINRFFHVGKHIESLYFRVTLFIIWRGQLSIHSLALAIGIIIRFVKFYIWILQRNNPWITIYIFAHKF